MGNVWQEPTIEFFPWPDLLTADEDEEKAFSGLLTEDEQCTTNGSG